VSIVGAMNDAVSRLYVVEDEDDKEGDLAA
jgi:hypothetical protein